MVAFQDAHMVTSCKKNRLDWTEKRVSSATDFRRFPWSQSEKEKHEIHARFYLSKIKARNFIRNNHIQYQLKEQEVNSTDMPRIA